MERYTNDYHTLPTKKLCETCKAYEARLEGKEDVKGNVKYYYECLYSKCKAKEEVK